MNHHRRLCDLDDDSAYYYAPPLEQYAPPYSDEQPQAQHPIAILYLPTPATPTGYREHAIYAPQPSRPARTPINFPHHRRRI